jgi:hypothetical protein
VILLYLKFEDHCLKLISSLKDECVFIEHLCKLVAEDVYKRASLSQYKELLIFSVKAICIQFKLDFEF